MLSGLLNVAYVSIVEGMPPESREVFDRELAAAEPGTPGSVPESQEPKPDPAEQRQVQQALMSVFGMPGA